MLFQLDPRPFQAAVAQAAGTPAKDQAMLTAQNTMPSATHALWHKAQFRTASAINSNANAKALAATVAADKAQCGCREAQS